MALYVAGKTFMEGKRMERGLQKVNQHSRLVEWGQRAEACRSSGQLRVDVHAGASAETIRAIIQALRSC